MLLPPHYYLLIPIGAIIALTIFFRPFWGLCLFILLISIEEGFIIGERLTALKILGIWVFFSWLIHFIHMSRFQDAGKATSAAANHFGNGSKQILFPQVLTIAVLLFVFWGLLSGLWAEEKSLVLERWFTMIQLLGFFFLVVQMANDIHKIRLLILSGVVGALIAGALMLLNFMEFGLVYLRISPLMAIGEGRYIQNPGHSGILLSLGIFYFLTSCLFSKTRWLIPSLMGFYGLLIGALLSGTRSFVVSFIAAMLFLFWYLWQHRSLSKWSKSIVISVIAILIAIYILPPYFFQRVQTIITWEDRGAGRLDIWKVALIQIFENPLLGVGLNNSWYRYGDYIGLARQYGFSIRHPVALMEGRDFHNIYLQTWGELGIIGIGLFIWMLVILIKQLNDYLRKLCLFTSEGQLGLTIALYFIALLVTGLSQPCLNKKYFWLGLSLVSAFYFLQGNKCGASIPTATAGTNDKV